MQTHTTVHINFLFQHLITSFTTILIFQNGYYVGLAPTDTRLLSMQTSLCVVYATRGSKIKFSFTTKFFLIILKSFCRKEKERTFILLGNSQHFQNPNIK